jgi:hypothetical protein
LRIRHILDPNVAGAIHHNCAHNDLKSYCHSDFKDAMSIEKRYFTSDFSNLS